MVNRRGRFHCLKFRTALRGRRNAKRPGTSLKSEESLLVRDSGGLLRQADRQLTSGESGRPTPQPRDEAVWRCAGLFVLAGDDVCVAAFPGDRIWIQD